jgi:bleomycin hydrolase
MASLFICYSNEFRADAKNVMMQNAAHSLDFTTLITNRDVLIQDAHVFNTKIPLEGPATDQKSSGRCWIFAALNVFRLEVMKKYNLEEFELSQGYMFFWDKFEKSNCKLRTTRDTCTIFPYLLHTLTKPIFVHLSPSQGSSSA